MSKRCKAIKKKFISTKGTAGNKGLTLRAIPGSSGKIARCFDLYL